MPDDLHLVRVLVAGAGSLACGGAALVLVDRSIVSQVRSLLVRRREPAAA